MPLYYFPAGSYRIDVNGLLILTPIQEKLCVKLKYLATTPRCRQVVQEPEVYPILHFVSLLVLNPCDKNLQNP